MKKLWSRPEIKVISVDLEQLGDVRMISDTQLKMKLEQAGYKFNKIYQASADVVYRKTENTDRLVFIDPTAADLEKTVSIDHAQVCLWKQLAEPSTLNQLEYILEEKYKIPQEQATETVINFINLLIKYNMVTIQ